jgi:hypothetical protein
LFFFTLLFCVVSSLSAQNRQKIVPVDSEIYQAIKSLYIAQGLALPSTSGPWSEGELLLMLKRLDLSRLTGSALDAYNFVEQELTATPRIAKFSIVQSLELHTHSNPESFLTEEDYIRPWNYQKPLVAFDFELFITDYMYNFFEFSLGSSVYNDQVDSATVKFYDPETGQYRYNTSNSTPDDPWQESELKHGYIGSLQYGKAPVSSNFPILTSLNPYELDWNFPARAFLAVGGNGWGIAIGRDRLSWGPGESGNFMVGDHIQYHNNFRLTFFNESLKYMFSISPFQSTDRYFSNDIYSSSDSDGAEGVWNDPDDRNPNRDSGSLVGRNYHFFMAHRVEWRPQFLKNKVNLVVTEGLMYHDTALDLSVFNPAYFMHNISRSQTTNSLLTAEADFSPFPFLNIYGQLAIDEMTFLNEPKPGEDTSAMADAFGYMIGAQTSLPLWKGMFTASMEFVKTDPFLYLRSADPHDDFAIQEAGQAGINFVVANRYDYIQNLYKEDFLGYRWGGDALVFNISAGFRVAGKWSIALNYFNMQHGTYDKWTTYSWVGPEVLENEANPDSIYENPYTGTTGFENPSTPTELHDRANHADPEAYKRNAVAYTNAFSLLGSWNFTKNLSVFGELDFVSIRNHGNIKSDTVDSDVQFTIGVTARY